MAAENVAALKAGAYTNLLVQPFIGPPQQVAWAIRRNAPRELRVNPNDPRQSIEGGCRYLWKLDQRWEEITPESEQIKFILASYNVGYGHVEDARRLAEKFGDDADRWSDVAYWLIRKSKRQYYNDPVVKYGFARGTEPVAYVDLILERYEHYKAFVLYTPIDAEPGEPEPQPPPETSSAHPPGS